MIAEIKSLTNRRLDLGGLTVVSLIIIFAAHQQAQANSDDLGDDIDNSIDSYQQGSDERRSAGIVDYPYRNSDCPIRHSMAYCLGWSGGYTTRFNAQKTIDESDRQNGNRDNNDSDDDNN